MIDTNIKGLLALTRRVVPIMRDQDGGHVINLGSTAGHSVYEGGSVYCATKHAVIAITETLRLEVADRRIRVTAISPGLVETEFSVVRFQGDQERADSVYADMTPLTAEDIAECILFAANRPPHVNIDEMIIKPLDQASVNKVIRRPATDARRD
jgi:NADP-dependent 3-hydroxy acid dehydrogenase YdfG